MPQAQITINAVIGSNTDLPINTLVQLNNNGIGGETTYLWTILDQPPGAVDSLSNTSIQNPTFTPKKEGTYLIRLIVNSTLPDEQIDTVVAAVLQVKTRNRIPAAGETTQADFADGWASDTNALLRRFDTQLADPGPVVCVNKQGSVITRGNVVRVTSGAVIKSGLPGQETVPGITLAPATTLGNLDELLLVVESDVLGNTNVADNALCIARIYGQINALPLGAGAVGDTVYVSDTATLSTTEGTNRRRAGSIMAVSGGNRDVWFDGVGGQDITPIDRRYLVYGPTGPLTNPVRVDGPGVGGGNISGGVPVLFKAADAITTPLDVQGFTGGLPIQRWLTGGGAVIMQMVREGLYDPTRGGLEFNSSYLFGAQCKATADAARSLILIRRSATQTGALLEWFDELTNTLGVIDAAGNLDLLNTARILNLPSPQTVGHAVNKIYADDMLYTVWAQNLVQNGAFDFNQRGIAGNITITVINTRTFHLDRWAGWITNAAADCRFSTAPVSNENWLRIAKNNAGATGVIYCTHEVDRELLNRSTLNLNVPLVLTFRANVPGGNYTASIRVKSGTSPTQAAPAVPAGTYATGDFTEVNTSVVNGLNTIVIPAKLNRGALSIQFYLTLTGTVGLGITMLEITDVMLSVAGANLPSPLNPPIPPFRRCGRSIGEEFAFCQKFYQRTYDLAVANGSASAVGRWAALTASIATANGANWPLGLHPRYVVPMRANPAITLYNPATGAAGSWDNAGTARASVASNISTQGFEVQNNTGVVTVPTAGAFNGHWVADAEL